MIADAAFDAALGYIVTNGTRLHFCSQEPTSNANVTSYTLANYPTITVGSPADRSPNGRRITIPACTGVTATGTGTATHWALVNGATNNILVAVGQLTTSFSISSGVNFNSAAADIGFPDAVTG